VGPRAAATLLRGLSRQSRSSALRGAWSILPGVIRARRSRIPLAFRDAVVKDNTVVTTRMPLSGEGGEPVDIVTTLYGRQERSWQIQANCMGVDPDLFFPERGASTREAKEVCRGCVVREDCLEYALANGEKFGIWGGMSERERRRVRRARALQRRDAAVNAS